MILMHIWLKIYFLCKKKARWEIIAKSAHKPEIGEVIDDAMRAIEKDNPKLKYVLLTNESQTKFHS